MLATLRQTLRKLERPACPPSPGDLPFGVPAIDAVLGGGLSRGTLHEIAASDETHLAAATGFALGFARGGSVIWAAEDMAFAENGALCGLGLNGFGFPPERLITVSVARHHDLLWTMEEALRCRATTVVVGETRQPRIDAVALRRISLAATSNGALALLLRTAPSTEASTAATRWVISGAPSQRAYGPGAPRFNAQLVRNRRGPLGSWVLEWSNIDERFVLAAAHSQSMAQAPFHRPALASSAIAFAGRRLRQAG